MHLHGGVGIDVEYPVHRYFAAAKRPEFTGGGATAQLPALGGLPAEADPAQLDPAAPHPAAPHPAAPDPAAPSPRTLSPTE